MFSLDKEQNKKISDTSKMKNNTGPTMDKETSGLTIPSISLPKGGGAIKGIGEKFSANSVTGTGSLSVPIFTSPGRSGFGPQLSLSYDSGSGNGPFGFGWTPSLPSITRKTDKGLPKYQDHTAAAASDGHNDDNFDESKEDVFILSGSEDLVPVFRKDQRSGEWLHDEEGNYIFEEVELDGYDVRQYRPRIEGLFARIERWTHKDTGDVHWRSISKDNVLTVYGRDEQSRIAEPATDDDESQRRRRIFSWLICQSYDDKGNAIVYQYSEENDEGLDLSQANEHNRVRTANRYIKRILYGNRQPLLLDMTKPIFRKSHIEQTDFSSAEWMFEVVFDYGEDHYKALPLDSSTPEEEQHLLVEASSASSEDGGWSSRPDPFSTYRAGFEVRTYRRCQRVLMFHRFPELGSEPCLVRSTEFDYTDFDYSQHQSSDILVKDELEHQGSTRFASFIQAVVQSGYVRDEARTVNIVNGVKYITYFKKSFPPLEFEYSKATIHEEVRELDAASLENLPYGLDNTNYQFVDLDGESISGILTEQAGAWFYKPNLGDGKFGPVQEVATRPSFADLNSGRQQLLDLAGDGQLDIIQLDGPVPGFYERSKDDKNWENFTPFASLPNIPWKDPSLKFVDLTGDGHSDVLITEDNVFSWYLSMAEEGFGSAQKVHQALEEEKGPRLVFDDGTQSIYLADMSGDGLTDLVRIRNGEACYWPNLGYGCFGAKVTMDNAPWFDAYDLFDQKRIRLTDIDGTGVTDIIYIGRDGVQIYFNQSGNRWSNAYTISNFPLTDNLSSSLQAIDLLGNGTACLVWSSILSSNFRRQMRYIDLMGIQEAKEEEKIMKGRRGRAKPHLLVASRNNLGAETKVYYASSTKFYLADKAAGKPWITRLPFPIHVVERVETYDHISRNRFVTRYAYHHGFFDGNEREFRGFGMIEQWDTEEFAALINSGAFPTGDNIEASSHVPPVYTKTWFHTGIYVGRGHISNYFAGLIDANDRGEYYREPALLDDDEQARKHLLEDTVLPDDLFSPIEEEFQACRALKGLMLRQEVYAKDGTNKEQYPYTVTEQNFTIKMLQPLANKKSDHAVFFTHSQEVLNYHYERNPDDPRISHTMMLEVDEFGNVLKQVDIGYGRRKPDPDLTLPSDRDKQTKPLITYSESVFTNSVNLEHVYRSPMPSETSSYELTGYAPTGAAGRYKYSDFVQPDPSTAGRLVHVPDTEIGYKDQPSDSKQRRLIERVRTLYRKDYLTAILELGKLEPLALPGENYKLAFTPDLLTQTFQRNSELLIPDPANVLGNHGTDGGGYLSSQQLKIEGKFPNTDPDNYWWIPTGRIFLSPSSNDNSTQELAYASSHFFLPHRYRDPFHTDVVSTESFVRYDSYDLLMVEARDAVANRITVGERLSDGNLDATKPGNGYRVLQPWRIMDQNRNRMQVSFDTLGMVAGTAVMGKPEEEGTLGDSLDGFEADLTQAQIDGFYVGTDPHVPGRLLLSGATTRIIYDLERFWRTQQAHPDDPSRWEPVYGAQIARETHLNTPLPAGGLKVQISFSYSDGFGREIQKKIQAEPGPLVEGGLVVSPRWVGSGWTIFNNKGRPVRQYEPFFSQLSPEKRHHFEYASIVGVSPVLFYDPLERVVATLHPNHSYEKIVFNPWEQITWDVNDTIRVPDNADDPPFNPKNDPDVGDHFGRLLDDEYLPTWYDLRTDTAKALKAWPNTDALGHPIPDNLKRRNAEKSAADKAAAHAKTPSVAYFDTLGRPFLTTVHNKVVCKDHDLDGTEDKFHTRIELDIEGNQRSVRDEVEENSDKIVRTVMLYDYDMLANRIHQSSMEAGERWMLNDVEGNHIRTWDSRGHVFRTEYDPLRRALGIFVTRGDPEKPDKELLTERLIYGEQHPNGEIRNLRDKLYCHLDQSGLVTNESYDFKGNLLRSARRIAKEYQHALDWRELDADHIAVPADLTKKLSIPALEARLETSLEKETFTSSTVFDALNRAVQVIAPHSDRPGTKYSVIQPLYNEANLLEQVHVWLYRSSEPTGLLDAAITQPSDAGVKNINYDAKGQRLRIDYSNGVSTFCEYDQLTFRLVHLLTLRNAATFPEDCPQPPTAGWAGCQVQNLHYTYDPMGNITYIRDDAQQRIFFQKMRMEPSAEYTYDAMYRLIKATGREHLGQAGAAPTPHSYDDLPHGGQQHPNDGRAMGNYTELYVYNAAGNILKMQHYGANPARPAWTRSYSYEEISFIEDGTNDALHKTNNRLSSTTVVGSHPSLEPYAYDSHGNMTYMPHFKQSHSLIPNMHWDFEDQLQQVDLDGGGTAYYVYDTSGQRVRKVHEHRGKLVDERLYIGNFEVYRKHSGAGLPFVLERETLHITDDQQRIAMVETRTIDTHNADRSPEQLIRFQFGNHLGSATLELDEKAQIISYEEYYPFGSTSYSARSNRTGAYKRYRYTGKEHDDETGLYYYRARYYAHWICRWLNCDPLGLIDGVCLYAYVRNNPINYIDTSGTLVQVVVVGVVIAEAAAAEIGFSIGVTAILYMQIKRISSPPRPPILGLDNKPNNQPPPSPTAPEVSGPPPPAAPPPEAPPAAPPAAPPPEAPPAAPPAAPPPEAPPAAPPSKPAAPKSPSKPASAKPDVKPDVMKQDLFRSKAVGPKHGKEGKGYDRRNKKHQKTLDQSRRNWGGPGPVPRKEDLDLGHTGTPKSRLAPGEEGVLKAQPKGENRSSGGSHEKDMVKKLQEESKKRNLLPHDPSNPFYTRPTPPTRPRKKR